MFLGKQNVYVVLITLGKGKHFLPPKYVGSYHVRKGGGWCGVWNFMPLKKRRKLCFTCFMKYVG